MELPDPKKFARKPSSVCCILDKHLELYPDLRTWIDTVLQTRRKTPRSLRVSMNEVLRILNTELGTDIPYHILRYYDFKNFAKGSNIDDGSQVTSTGQISDSKPPGWEDEQAAVSIPSETETNNTR